MKMTKPLKIGWGIPAYKRNVDIGAAQMMLRMGGSVHYYKENHDVDFLGVLDTDSCSVPYSRNQMVYLSMSNDADWLIMSDADTYTLDPGLAIEMCLEGEKLGAAMMAAPCLMRNGKGYNICIELGDPWAQWEQLEGKVQEIVRAGSGFIALNLSWIRENWLESPWFYEVHLPGPKPMRVGSDIAISDTIRGKGGQIYCYGLFEPRHVGVGATGHEMVDQKERERVEQATEAGVQ